LKCVLIENTHINGLSQLNTPEYTFNQNIYEGQKKILKRAEGNLEKYLVDYIDFEYVNKADPNIIIGFNLSLSLSRYSFEKIELHYLGNLSEVDIFTDKFIKYTTNQVRIILEHLFNQKDKLCKNCAWIFSKECTGFCDNLFLLNKLKSI
jgi:hypothetical protein